MTSAERTAGPGKTAGKGKVVGIAIAGAVGGFLFGFDSSVVNGATDPIEKTFGLTASATGFAVASALLGCALGAYLAGRIADRWGRIPAMLVGSVLFLVSAIGAGLAFGVIDLILWRVVGGLGIGIASVIAPAYIAEISPSGMRGRLGSLQQLAIVLGIFTALLSDAVLAAWAGGAGQELWWGLAAWRWMFLVGAVPAVVYGLIALRLPESPRYLILKGRDEEAASVLTRIGSAVTTTVETIRKDLEVDKAAEATGTLRGKAAGLKPIVWVGIGLSILQQFVGINVIFYYSTMLWQSVGFPESAALQTSVFTSVTNIVVTLIAIALVDKIGRRPLLLIGSIGMTISLGAMAVAFSTAEVVDGAPMLEGAWGTIALIAANLFVVFFGASWGPVVWVLLGEMFPNSIRARALGVAASAQWIANFLITVSFPALSGFSLVFTYAMYAAFAAVSFIFVFFLIPETKGRTLEDAGRATVERRHAPAATTG